MEVRGIVLKPWPLNELFTSSLTLVLTLLIFFQLTMATGGEDPGQLTRKQIVRLAAAISADNMASIAEGYMDISPRNHQEHQKYATPDNSEAFNRDVIRHWMYRNPKEQNTVELPHNVTRFVTIYMLVLLKIAQPQCFC